MRKAAAFRITADLCFYFSVITAFSALRPLLTPMAWFTVLCFAVTLAAARCPWAAVRLVLSLLPGLAFLFTPLRPLLLYPAAAWLYFILKLTIGNFGVYLNEYRRTFRAMAVICLFFVITNGMNAMLFRGKPLSMAAMTYLSLFLILGVLTMRDAQMGTTMDLRWQAANALTVVGTLTVSAALSLALYGLLRLLRPVFLFLLSVLGWGFDWLLSLLPEGGAVPETTPMEVPSPTPDLTGFTEDVDELLPEVEDMLQETSPLAEKVFSLWPYLLTAVLAAAVLCVIIALARRGGRQVQEEEYDYEDTEYSRGARERRNARRESARGNAGRVRKLYREYLAWLQLRGLRRRAADTSLEILTGARRLETRGPEEAQQELRRIYLKARYSPGAVTDADLAEARRCLAAVRNQEA